MSDLETVEHTTGPDPRAAVIWLHGLGADGHDFEPIVPQLQWPAGPDMRFVFPHAPVRPVTINGGMPMRAWYDIVNLDGRPPSDQAGIESSAAGVVRLIEREGERGIPPERVLLAGFSQGGAIALHAGLRYPEPLAGIMGLSTYLLMAERLESERSAANLATPLFLAHGTLDPVVPFTSGERSREHLAAMGYAIEWHSYNMPHGVCPEEIDHIRHWFGELFSGL
ncbi:MAG: carboxylesterase [Gammaproteobacteria bacterium]|jgi:phospholipase/carboxylesterase